MPSDVDGWLDDINRELDSVGRIPRLLSAGLVVVFGGLCIVGWLASGVGFMLIAAAVPIALFVLALRVGASTNSDQLIVRSYVRTTVIDFGEVVTFTNLPYSGMWNRFAGTDGWLNLGLRMIDVTFTSRTGKSFPATMLSSRRCARIVDLLDQRLASLDEAYE